MVAVSLMFWEVAGFIHFLDTVDCFIGVAFCESNPSYLFLPQGEERARVFRFGLQQLLFWICDQLYMKYVSRSLLLVNVSVCVCVLSHVFKSNYMLKQNPNPKIVNMCLIYIYMHFHICIHMYTPYISINVNILWIFIASNRVTDTGSPIRWRCFSIARQFKAGTDPRSSRTSFSNHSGRSETEGSVAVSNATDGETLGWQFTK